MKIPKTEERNTIKKLLDVTKKNGKIKTLTSKNKNTKPFRDFPGRIYSVASQFESNSLLVDPNLHVYARARIRHSYVIKHRYGNCKCLLSRWTKRKKRVFCALLSKTLNFTCVEFFTTSSRIFKYGSRKLALKKTCLYFFKENSTVRSFEERNSK